MSWPSVYLSKSDFLKYQVCPSYLWLWKYKKEVVPVDSQEDIARRLEQGNEVERYARELFPQAVLVKSSGIEAQQETNVLIDKGAKSLFQATVISKDGLLAMADIITYDEKTKTWTLIEVKSTNSIKKEHLYDITFQKVAFEASGYKIGTTKIIHLNKDYVRRSTITATDFLIETDVSSKVGELYPTIKDQAHDALDLLKVKEEPKSCSCRLKSKSNHCPTFHYLNPDIPEYSVFNISRMNGKKLNSLIDNEIFHVHDVPDDMKLSETQRNQVEAHKSGQTKINTEAIKEMLSELEFPLYFLDYETVSTAVPLYNGCKPYQQIPFQYSLHIIREPNGKLEHYEYLSRDSKTLPAESLLESLEKLVDDNGSIIVWNKSFEMGRNREMANTYPNYHNFIESVNDRVFDLMDVFKKQHLVHPDFKGSSSIKAILPVLVPELSYKDIDIQNGQVASVRWYDAVTNAVDDIDANKIFNDLLKYCCLDTLAMVEIYRRLMSL
jgi:hypothetical protein